MKDKELLELAAKAAGYDVWWHHAKQCYLIADGTTERRWNPLTDDCDALRLAVKLNMNLDVINGVSGAQVLHVAFCSESHGDDPYAATRRAIVRAAAEIGKGMQ